MIRQSGERLWAQIERTLSREIADGVILPGSKLPSEAQLARRFEVNRHTVRQALNALEQQGLIRTEHGRGSFVEEAVHDYLLGERTRFSQGLQGPGAAKRQQLLRHFECPADRDLAESLDVPMGTTICVLETQGMADDRPLSLAQHMFERDRFPGIAERFVQLRSITRALATFGIDDYVRKFTRISAVMPSPEEARKLRQPRNRPLLRSESVNVDLQGRPMEYGVTLFAGDRVQFVIAN